MKKIFFCTLLFLSTAGFAALPPLFESVREIEAILKDRQLVHCLGSSEMIEDIIRTQTGYVILTPKYHLEVNIHYKHSDKIGPAEFALEFLKPINRDSSCS